MSALWTALRRDFKLKLASLALALLVWAWRTAEGNPVAERRFGPLPVEPVNLARGLVLVNEAPLVEVTLRGPQQTLERLARSGALRPQVDCSAIERPSWPVLAITVPTPETVTLVEVKPAEWEVEVDTSEVDVRPVRADLGRAAPPPGFLYEEPVLSHTQAQVSGPRKAVGRVAYLAAPIDLSGRLIDYTGQVRLRPTDALGQPVAGVQCEPRAVTVTVKVAKLEASRKLPVIVRLVGAGARPGAYQVDPPVVTVHGTSGGLEQIGRFVSTMPVELADLVDGAATAELALPPGLVAEPAKVRVRLPSGR